MISNYGVNPMGKKKKKKSRSRGYGFGTAPVFLTSICAILGAVVFLRFGFAVGNVGLLGALLIILIGHMITIPTGMAISEIATNQRIGGGGEYYIISRSFGLRIGATIGVMLYAAQAISVGFYVIGFAEGFNPFSSWIQSNILDLAPIHIAYDPRFISIPMGLILFTIIILKGAKIGIRLLWVVFALMIAAIVFFMVSPPHVGSSIRYHGGRSGIRQLHHRFRHNIPCIHRHDCRRGFIR